MRFSGRASKQGPACPSVRPSNPFVPSFPLPFQQWAESELAGLSPLLDSAKSLWGRQRVGNFS